MDTKHISFLASAFFVGFAGHASAQVPAPAVPVSAGQGMWTADAVGLQWRDGAGEPRLVVRDAGVTGTSLGGWSEARFGAPTLDHPDYSSRKLFAHWVPEMFQQNENDWSAGDPRHNPILGGWSTGGDITPGVDSLGVLQYGISSIPAWYNLSFTVGGGATGVPGSALQEAIQNTGSAAGHIYSYTADGSSGIRADFVHTVRTEYTRAQIGGLTGNAELTALDWGVGLISETSGLEFTRLQPTRDRLYFTLSQEWLTAHNPGPMPGPITPASNVVYGMEWDGVDWSDPVVAFSELDLFGSAQPVAELDAISVYSYSQAFGQEPTVVFSLTPDSVLLVDNTVETPDQILVTQRGAYHPFSASDATAATLSVVTGGTAFPVSEVAGLEVDPPPGILPDDVTGLCGRDPYEGQTPDTTKGVPTEGAFGSNGVDLALLRHFDVSKTLEKDNLVETLRMVVSGIDEANFDLVYIEFFLSIWDDETGTGLTPIIVFPTVDTWGEAQAGFLERVIPFTLPPGSGYELRCEAIVTGIVATPFGFVPSIARSGMVGLGLD